MLARVNIVERANVIKKISILCQKNLYKADRFLFCNREREMVYGYIRVSTDKQTVENQRFEIENFCKNEKNENVS